MLPEPPFEPSVEVAGGVTPGVPLAASAEPVGVGVPLEASAEPVGVGVAVSVGVGVALSVGLALSDGVGVALSVGLALSDGVGVEQSPPFSNIQCCTMLLSAAFPPDCVRPLASSEASRATSSWLPSL